MREFAVTPPSLRELVRRLGAGEVSTARQWSPTALDQLDDVAVLGGIA